MSEHPPASGQQIGSTIGATAGLVFIQLNAGSLPGGIAVAVRALGVAAFLAVVTLTVLRRGEEQQPGPTPTQQAWRIYWSMVIFEVILLPLGVKILLGMHHPELTVPWVALIVGAHFLPFAKAFGVPRFLTLAWTMIALALIGGVLAVAVSPAAGHFVAGVLSGVSLLASALPRRRPTATVGPRARSLTMRP